MESLRVELGERSYSIVIGEGVLGGLGQALSSMGATRRAALVSNPTVLALYGGAVEASLREAGFEPAVVAVPDGEEYKSLEWAGRVLTELLTHGLDRGSLVVALGGGVIGDLAGFAASVYMRGIRCIQAPTTLLAQVDSSVGGKTGVNHPLGKNLIGTFWQPSLVWIDVGTLKTLPRRETLAGMAEVIKYGVIWDEGFFGYVLAHRDAILGLEPAPLAHIVRRSCEIKAEVVRQDEREGGLRAILNFGHTIGHAVEAATGYTKYLHGEAVSIGMCLAAGLSARMGLAHEDVARKVKAAVEAYGLPSSLPEGIDSAALLSAMKLDKKTLGGALRFTLPERVGQATVNVEVGREALEGFLRGL